MCGLLGEAEVDFIVALIFGWIERQVDEKEGGAFRQYRKLASPSSYSLLQPLEEHAGRLKRDNFELMFACDTLKPSSWFPFQPKDDALNFKAVQSL
jgi:hypothetical protein